MGSAQGPSSAESSSYTWIVVVGGFLSFSFAWGMGANDVPNAYGSSVGSRVISLKQAVVISSFFELIGIYAMGDNVIKTLQEEVVHFQKIVESQDERGEAGKALVMWGLTCCLASSTVWVLTASWRGWPVSSTQTIIGTMVVFACVIGNGNKDYVDWDRAVLRVLGSWVIGPPVTALLSGLSFLALKRYILQPPDSETRALAALPIAWTLIAVMIALVVLFESALTAEYKAWKTHKGLTPVILLVVGGIAYGIADWVAVPRARERLNRYGHRATRRVEAELVALQGQSLEGGGGGDGGGGGRGRGRGGGESDGQVGEDEVEDGRVGGSREGGGGGGGEGGGGGGAGDRRGLAVRQPAGEIEGEEMDVGLPADGGRRERQGVGSDAPAGSLIAPQPSLGDMFGGIKGLYSQLEANTFGRELVFDESTVKIHKLAEKFNPRVEELFYPLQLMPACAVAFAHGTNDVANQLAPFSLIYAYHTDGGPGDKYTWLWMKAIVWLGICLGFAIMGWKVTRSLGGALTLMTPSRGFTCQLCAAITVAMASGFGWPVSTTQILIGSTVGVGAADNYRTVDWWLFGKFFLSWLATVIAGGSMTALFVAVSVFSPSLKP